MTLTDPMIELGTVFLSRQAQRCKIIKYAANFCQDLKIPAAKQCHLMKMQVPQ